MKSAVKIQRSFDKAEEVERSKYGELLGNWNNE